MRLIACLTGAARSETLVRALDCVSSLFVVYVGNGSEVKPNVSEIHSLFGAKQKASLRSER